MKEFAYEMWNAIKMTAAAALTTVGCMIGLPAMVLGWISDALNDAGARVYGSIKECEDDIEEDVIYE